MKKKIIFCRLTAASSAAAVNLICRSVISDTCASSSSMRHVAEGVTLVYVHHVVH